MYRKFLRIVPNRGGTLLGFILLLQFCLMRINSVMMVTVMVRDALRATGRRNAKEK